MRKLSLLFFLPILLAALPVRAAPVLEPSVSARVLTIAAQRAETERLVRAYCQVGLNVNAAAGRVDLAEAIAGFESGFEHIRQTTPMTGPQAAAVEALERHWRDMHAILVEPPTARSALRMAHASDAALAAMSHLESLGKFATGGAGDIAVLLVRQDELAQRMAALYLMRSMLAQPAPGQDELERTREALMANLGALEQQVTFDPKLHGALDRMAVQIDWLQAAVEGEGVRTYPLVVADAAEGVREASFRLGQLVRRGSATPPLSD